MALRPSLRFFVLDRDDFRCRYCGANGDDVELHVDHVLPKSKGGRDEPSNLVAACSTCNIGKSARLLTPPAETIAADEKALAHADALLEVFEYAFWRWCRANPQTHIELPANWPKPIQELASEGVSRWVVETIVIEALSWASAERFWPTARRALLATTRILSEGFPMPEAQHGST